MIASTLIYIRKDSKTLMLLRDKKDIQKHKLRFNGVGGKMEKGETPDDCARREVYEETGLKVGELDYRAHLYFPDFDEEGDWLVFVYECFDFSGEIVESEEGSLHWIIDEDVPYLNLWEGDKEFIKLIYETKSFFWGDFIYKDGRYISSNINIYNET